MTHTLLSDFELYYSACVDALEMQEALEEVMGERDNEGLPCPLCGRPSTKGHRHNCIRHVVEADVRKARDEE